MTDMNVARYKTNGPAEKVLFIDRIPVPQPGKGQVRLRMVLSPVHNHDVITVAGGYGVTPSLPAVAGTEALGIVDAVGEGVTMLVPGDRVVAAGLTGAWADYYLADAARLLPVPADVPDVLAAQLAGMPFDALLAFKAIGAKKGEWLIINAANGAVGRAIMQIARDRGVNTIGLVHSAKSRDALVGQGFRHIFDTSDGGWTAAARALFGKARVAGGLDMVGGPLVGTMASLLSPDAVLLVLGAMSDAPMTVPAAPVIFGELTLKGFWAAREAGRLSPTEIRERVGEVLALARKGALDLPAAATYPLSRITEAMVAMGKARNGKILLQRG